MTYFDKQALHEYLKIAAILRTAGVGVEVYPDAKKLGAQLKYAGQRGFRAAIIAGSDELARGTCQVKNLRTESSSEVPWRENHGDLLAAVNACL